MKDFGEGQRERISKTVEELLLLDRQNINDTGLYQATNSKENFEHVVDIGTSVLCAKWEIGYKPGGFVQALIDNDLKGAFRKADKTNENCIGFYLRLMEAVGYIS